MPRAQIQRVEDSAGEIPASRNPFMESKISGPLQTMERAAGWLKI
jgi:hypothetical protein